MEFIYYLLGDDLPAAGFIILNLILIESLLSVDNAAVLATMVMDLPEHQRPKALKWGIVGAYLFRGLALVFASILLKFWWLKVIGGVYLLYLCLSNLYHFSVSFVASLSKITILYVMFSISVSFLNVLKREDFS